ncbi:MAG: GDP-mannose dehydrogenase [Nitrososphaerota archaeon]|jgi:UDP-N-acetyl-D-mannosaminuronate dehydrogenase|nr:GDP-mannose dehydrogenase [Nitrososphaerota archaeon]
MTQEAILIVGLGEIGHTLFSLYAEKKSEFAVYGLDLDQTKMQKLNQDKNKIPNKIDILQVALPCESPEKFAAIIADYAKQYQPVLVIVNSTVPPGTTLKVAEKCGCQVVHSPARGVHISAEHMVWEMKRWSKYIGGATLQAAKAAKTHFEKLGLKVKVLKSCNETELAKLFETTYRAWMITCFQEMHRISRAFNADFNDTVDFLEDTHRQRYDRPVMFPGYIGGHCLIPNTELLFKVYNSDFLRLILASNEKRKEEMNDPKIKAEAQMVANRAIALEKELSGEKNVILPQKPAKTTDPSPN